jgi:hypothetical protein
MTLREGLSLWLGNSIRSNYGVRFGPISEYSMGVNLSPTFLCTRPEAVLGGLLVPFKINSWSPSIHCVLHSVSGIIDGPNKRLVP